MLKTSITVLLKWMAQFWLLLRQDGPNATNPWSTILLGRQVGVPYTDRIHENKCDMVDRRRITRLVEMEVSELLQK